MTPEQLDRRLNEFKFLFNINNLWYPWTTSIEVQRCSSLAIRSIGPKDAIHLYCSNGFSHEVFQLQYDDPSEYLSGTIRRFLKTPLQTDTEPIQFPLAPQALVISHWRGYQFWATIYVPQRREDFETILKVPDPQD